MKRYVFKVDLDKREPFERYKEKWIETRKLILEHLGFKIYHIDYELSGTGRGYHVFFICDSERELTDDEINCIQFLLGDDIGRVAINIKRIERGIKYWNKMFSKVLWKRPYDYEYNRFLELMKKENLTEEEKEWITDYVSGMHYSILKWKEILEEDIQKSEENNK